jgi:hypothetical protein
MNRPETIANYPYRFATEVLGDYPIDYPDDIEDELRSRIKELEYRIVRLRMANTRLRNANNSKAKALHALGTVRLITDRFDDGQVTGRVLAWLCDYAELEVWRAHEYCR